VKRKVGIGVIGTGFGVRTQVPVWSSLDDAYVAAVCSSSQERAEHVASSFGIPHAVSDFGQLSRLDDVDLVAVTVTPDLHHPAVAAALDAGKHVLCDKPFCLNSAEAADLVDRARLAGVLNFMNNEFLVAPNYRRLRALVRAGAIGRPLYLSFLDFDGFAVREQHRMHGWWFDRERGGGWLMNHASHHVFTILDLLGPILSVSGLLGRSIEQAALAEGRVPSTVDDAYSLQLGLAGGAIGSILSGAAAPVKGYERRWEVYGQEGTLQLIGPRLVMSTDGRPPADVEIPPLPALPGADHHAPFFAAWAREIIDCIRTGEQRGPTFADGLATQRVLDAAFESDRTGSRILIRPSAGALPSESATPAG
jgi:predicted dehydrogenase